ncbi:Clathrin adaptor [Babesia duncani]|uniref:Clathrin adaptor n=1 Tax=Babesia duncani TaxID=323732 RepID=A0AAD9PMV2_9APIC|nr:Clathrin adaptor [Babesia duncani]
MARFLSYLCSITSTAPPNLTHYDNKTLGLKYDSILADFGIKPSLVLSSDLVKKCSSNNIKTLLGFACESLHSRETSPGSKMNAIQLVTVIARSYDYNARLVSKGRIMKQIYTLARLKHGNGTQSYFKSSDKGQIVTCIIFAKRAIEMLADLNSYKSFDTDNVPRGTQLLIMKANQLKVKLMSEGINFFGDLWASEQSRTNSIMSIGSNLEILRFKSMNTRIKEAEYRISLLEDEMVQLGVFDSECIDSNLTQITEIQSSLDFYHQQTQSMLDDVLDNSDGSSCNVLLELVEKILNLKDVCTRFLPQMSPPEADLIVPMFYTDPASQYHSTRGSIDFDVANCNTLENCTESIEVVQDNIDPFDLHLAGIDYHGVLNHQLGPNPETHVVTAPNFNTVEENPNIKISTNNDPVEQSPSMEKFGTLKSINSIDKDVVFDDTNVICNNDDSIVPLPITGETLAFNKIDQGCHDDSLKVSLVENYSNEAFQYKSSTWIPTISCNLDRDLTWSDFSSVLNDTSTTPCQVDDCAPSDIDLDVQVLDIQVAHVLAVGTPPPNGVQPQDIQQLDMHPESPSGTLMKIHAYLENASKEKPWERMENMESLGDINAKIAEQLAIINAPVPNCAPLTLDSIKDCIPPSIESSPHFSNVSIIKGLINLQNSIIYQDEMVQVGFLHCKGYPHNFMISTCTLVITNTSTCCFDHVQFDFADFEHFPFQMTLDSQLLGTAKRPLAPGKVQTTKFDVYCQSPYVGMPKLTLVLLMNDNMRRVLDIYIPIAISRYTRPAALHEKHYMATLTKRVYCMLLGCSIQEINTAGTLGGAMLRAVDGDDTIFSCSFTESLDETGACSPTSKRFAVAKIAQMSNENGLGLVIYSDYYKLANSLAQLYKYLHHRPYK